MKPNGLQEVGPDRGLVATRGKGEATSIWDAPWQEARLTYAFKLCTISQTLVPPIQIRRLL